MSDLERLKNGICPFTGKRYDCGRCEAHETLKHPEGTYGMHIGMNFDGMLLDGKTGQRRLHKYVGGKAACTFDECVDYFADLFQLGATVVPVGVCDRFCYRRGCMGHADEEARNG